MLSWLAIHKNEVADFALVDVLFGKFDSDKDFIVINHILPLAKFLSIGVSSIIQNHL